MASNHMIIGLGGTGGKIIRDIRKAIAMDTVPNDEVFFEYLYMDSSSEMMGFDDPKWKILGKSVQLSQSQQLLIEGAGLSGLLADVDAYPNIRSWIEPLDVIKNIAKSNVDSAQGGQRRKLGRFLFACSARTFVGKIADRVEELRKKNNNSLITFHVCVGLAGGTGSGSVVDVVSQIRKLYPDPKDYRILIYALLPDEQPKAGWNSGNYHANGYAALAELNALAVGSLHPFDVAGSGKRLTDLGGIVFNGCYLFSNENESNIFVDVDDALPKIVADFIYQKTLGLDWKELRRAENSENGDKADEVAVGGGRNERSKRFLTFGIRRLMVPQDEIREYLSYNFAAQSARQFMYNNWIEGQGYSNEARPRSHHEEVTSPDAQNRWSITDEHLTLSLGILPDDVKNSRWKQIADFWTNVVPQHKLDIQNSNPKKTAWIDELKKRCDQIYSEGYRALGGVRKFYEIKLKDKTDIARHVRNTIEQELFDDWRTGNRSLSEISKLLGALSELLEEKLSHVDDRIVKLRTQSEDASARVSEVVQEWSKVNWISDMLGKGDKLFNKAAEYLTQLYIYRTYGEAWLFAKKLLEELNQQMIDLRGEVEKMLATMSTIAQDFDRQVRTRLAEDKSDSKSHRQRIYNRDAVFAVNKRLLIDEGTQKKQTQEARARLIAMLGEDQKGFAAFNQRVDPSAMQSTLEECSEEQAMTAHAVLGAEHQQVMNMNIIEKLFEEYGANDEALATFVRKTISHAGVYLTFDDQEERKQGPGTDTEDKHIRTAGLFLPPAKDRGPFAAKVRRLFEENKTTNAFDVITEGTRENEITFIRVDNLFPLRFARATKFLKQKYEERISASPANKYLLHGEGDGVDLLPLFIPAMGGLKAQKRSMLLVARALSLITDRKSGATGKTETVFLYQNEDGLDDELVLGKTFLEGADEISLDLDELGMIERRVKHMLDERSMKHEDARREIYKKVVDLINEVKVACGGDLHDPIYKRFAAESKQVKALLELE